MFRINIKFRNFDTHHDIFQAQKNLTLLGYFLYSYIWGNSGETAENIEKSFYCIN